MTTVLTLIAAASTILTAFFAAYGLTNQYRDSDGKITRAGKLALRGIFSSAVLSLLSIGLGVLKANMDQTAAIKKLQDETHRYTETLNRLERIVHNTERLSYPLSSANVSMQFLIGGSDKKLSAVRQSILDLLPIWNREIAENGMAFSDSKNYIIYHDRPQNHVNMILILDQTRIRDCSLSFTHVLILGPPGKSLRLANLNVVDDNQPLVTALFRDVVRETLVYYPDSDAFGYQLVYKPKVLLSDPRFSSMLDLLSSELAVSVLQPEDIRSWQVKAIRLFSDTGYSVSLDMKSFEIIGKPWPQITFTGKLRPSIDSSLGSSVDFR
jgi:hypothetical protein